MPPVFNEPRIYRIVLRANHIDVVAVSHDDALKTWRREASNHDGIDYDGEEPDSVVTDPNGGWVAISAKAWKAYNADIKERAKETR